MSRANDRRRRSHSESHADNMMPYSSHDEALRRLRLTRAEKKLCLKKGCTLGDILTKDELEAELCRLRKEESDLKTCSSLMNKELDALNMVIAVSEFDPSRVKLLNDELPDLPELFPLNMHETERLKEVMRLGIFNVELPIPPLEELVAQHMASIQKQFPKIEAVFVSATGAEEYRILASRIRQPNGEFTNGVEDTKYAQFGHRCLSACQYVTAESVTLCFSEKNVIPLKNAMKRWPNLFDALGKHNDKLQMYIDDSRNRKAWGAICRIMSDRPQIASKFTPEITNMFEFFSYYKNNYIGSPIIMNGQTIGVVCFLHKMSSSAEDKWMEWSRIEELAFAMSDTIDNHLKQARKAHLNLS